MLDLSSSGSRGRAGHHRPWLSRLALAVSRPRGAWLRVIAVAGLIAGALALSAPTASVAAERAAGAQPAGSAAQATAASAASAAQTAEQYVIRFWPRWISFAQQSLITRIHGADTFIGPQGMSPLYSAVVAINDDTLYCSAFVDTRLGPAILTIPATPNVYSLLPLNVFGDTFNTSIKPQTPGTYALVPPGWRGTLPRGVTKVTDPYPVTLWIIRTDKYSSTGVNMTASAAAFRAALHMTTLAKYEADPASGAAKIVPIVPSFAVPFKVLEGLAVTRTPNAFLRQTQRAVADPSTAPMYASDLQLSAAFNQDFAAAQQAARRGNPVPLARIDAAARAAYRALNERWNSHVVPGTHWVHFTNIAAWGTAYLDRAAGTEYIQYGNNEAAAGYWDASVDGAGQTLNAARHGYTLTFPAGDIPQVKRFWSLTAYVPGNIRLVRNPANKYLVASYTPGLVTNPDGSITIYLAPTRPAGAPMANWLPVPRGQFAIVLRAYGPTGNTANPDYAPPAITPTP